MPRKGWMTRITQSRLRRRWRRLAARWVELLWSCPCEYTNVATYRCYGCGARPPREVRTFLATVPMPALADRAGGGRRAQATIATQ
jgi:hypothetical protein